MFMVHRSWSRQRGNVNVDQPSMFHDGVINLCSVPMNKNVEIHVEHTKVLPSS